MDSQTEEIKGRIDIVDFIGQYVQLKKSGINHKGLCPFHNEKTPSFMVNGERQIYKCFGCGEAGDIFDFVQKQEGMDFYESLKYLAERAGVQLKTRDPQEARERQESKTSLIDLNKTLAKLYHQLLLTHRAGTQARSYIVGRKISKETVEKFQIGYAPQHTEHVRDYLYKMGFSDKDLSAAGNPERFRDRLMFPIADIVGNIVGFSGRALQKDQEPKYLNTRETPIFHKAKVLYGFDNAKKQIRQCDEAILVEGQMDVVLSHQAKVENTVATSGTALTEDHLQIIRRQTQNLCLSFDADDAGQKTTIKAVEMAWRQGLTVKVVTMPEGYKDAGEVVEKDPALWRDTIKKALPAYDWLWQMLSKKYGSRSTGSKKEVSMTIIPLISAVSNSVEKDDYIQRLSKDLNIGENAIRENMMKLNANPRSSSVASSKEGESVSNNEWEELLALLYIYPDKIIDVKNTLSGKLGSSKVAEVYEKVFAWYNKPQSERGADFLKVLPENLSKKVKIISSSFQSQLEDNSEIEKDIDQRLRKLSGRWREKVKSDFAQKIAEAEKSGNIKEVQKLMQELQNQIK